MSKLQLVAGATSTPIEISAASSKVLEIDISKLRNPLTAVKKVETFVKKNGKVYSVNEGPHGIDECNIVLKPEKFLDEDESDSGRLVNKAWLKELAYLCKREKERN